MSAPDAYRAAYIPAAPDSTGGGIRLTQEAHATLSDAELMAQALAEAQALGLTANDLAAIEIGLWREIEKSHQEGKL